MSTRQILFELQSVMSQARSESEFSIDTARQLNEILVQNRDMLWPEWREVNEYFEENIHPVFMGKVDGLRFTEEAANYLMNSEGHERLDISMKIIKLGEWMEKWEPLYMGVFTALVFSRLLYIRYGGYIIMSALTQHSDHIYSQGNLYICDGKI